MEEPTVSATRTTSTSTADGDDKDNGRYLLEFVSLPMHPVRVGSVLAIFLENITLSYRRRPAFVLMDPWPKDSTSYHSNICHKLKSKLGTDNQARLTKVKLVKYKRSPPQYAVMYRRRLEAKKNLALIKTKEILESFNGNCRTSKKNYENCKPSQIPVWIGNKKVKSTSVTTASAASDANTKQKFAGMKSSRIPQMRNSSMCKEKEDVSRIPKLILPIIPEESLLSAKASIENFKDLKTETIIFDKLSPIPELELCLAKNQNEPQPEMCFYEFASEMACSCSVENRQEWNNESLSSNNMSCESLPGNIMENPKTFLDISLTKDPMEVKTKTSSSASSGAEKTKPTCAALFTISLAVGDGNEHVFENIVHRSKSVSLKENLRKFIISDTVSSFVEASKAVLEVYPNLSNERYVTLNGHGGCKLKNASMQSRKSSLPCYTKKDLEITLSETKCSSSQSASPIASTSSSLTSFIHLEQEIMNSELFYENDMKIERKNSDEGISKEDITESVTTIKSPSSQVASSIVTPENEMKIECKNSAESSISKLDIKETVTTISASSQIAINIATPENEMKTEFKNCISNVDVVYTESATKISSSCRIASNIATPTSSMISITCSEQEIASSILFRKTEKEMIVAVEREKSDESLSKVHITEFAIKRSSCSPPKSTPDPDEPVSDLDNGDDDSANYLRILLAAREGLLKEIHRSLKIGYRALQERYAYLNKMNLDAEDVKKGPSEDDDWISLLKSSLKFAYWMIDFCDKSRNEIRNFEKINIFKGKSKLGKCYYKVTTMMDGDEVSGIFIPIPPVSSSQNVKV